jgi:hypothetical protein
MGVRVNAMGGQNKKAYAYYQKETVFSHIEAEPPLNVTWSFFIVPGLSPDCRAQGAYILLMALTETFSKRYRTELVNSSREKSHIRPRKVYLPICKTWFHFMPS